MSNDHIYQKTKAEFNTGSEKAHLYRLKKLEESGYYNISKLPFTIRILLESVLREHDGFIIKDKDIELLANYDAKSSTGEIPYKPCLVVLQDFTGVSAVVDLAARRSAMWRRGGNGTAITPQVPVDWVSDRSVQVDEFGQEFACMHNVEKEFERTRNRC